MDKKLTINDIAKMSGVAKSTVSRYLNGGSVRPSTGQKIKKIIEENNYDYNINTGLNILDEFMKEYDLDCLIRVSE